MSEKHSLDILALFALGRLMVVPHIFSLIR